MAGFGTLSVTRMMINDITWSFNILYRLRYNTYTLDGLCCFGIKSLGDLRAGRGFTLTGLRTSPLDGDFTAETVNGWTLWGSTGTQTTLTITQLTVATKGMRAGVLTVGVLTAVVTRALLTWWTWEHVKTLTLLKCITSNILSTCSWRNCVNKISIKI